MGLFAEGGAGAALGALPEALEGGALAALEGGALAALEGGALAALEGGVLFDTEAGCLPDAGFAETGPALRGDVDAFFAAAVAALSPLLSARERDDGAPPGALSGSFGLGVDLAFPTFPAPAFPPPDPSCSGGVTRPRSFVIRITLPRSCVFFVLGYAFCVPPTCLQAGRGAAE
jgi:hypothetical protein